MDLLLTTYAISAYHHLSCEFESCSGEVFSIQHYVIKFVSDLWRDSGFLRFPLPINLTTTIQLLKPLGQFKQNCPRMIIGRSSTKFRFFMLIGNPRWPPLQEIDYLDPIGKCSNAFFSETTNMIKAKLNMNVHWMVLYKLQVFCSDMKFKMAATTGLGLTLDPLGKMFQNASSLKPLGQLKPNYPGITI